MFILNPRRFARHEIWERVTDRAVPGVKPFYLVSNYGRVYSEETNSLVSQHKNQDGYMHVSLKTNNKTISIGVHRLEMLVLDYIEGCEKLEVDHLHCMRDYNYLWGLEWVTHTENIKRAFEKGTANSTGENNNMAILTDEQVRIICKALEDNKSLEEIESMIGEHDSSNFYRLIWNIRNGRRWAHISKDYDIPQLSYRNFDPEQVKDIRKYLEDNMTSREILNKLGIDTTNMEKKTFNKYKTAISRIKTGKFYNNI